MLNFNAKIVSETSLHCQSVLVEFKFTSRFILGYNFSFFFCLHFAYLEVPYLGRNKVLN